MEGGQKRDRFWTQGETECRKEDAPTPPCEEQPEARGLSPGTMFPNCQPTLPFLLGIQKFVGGREGRREKKVKRVREIQSKSIRGQRGQHRRTLEIHSFSSRPLQQNTSGNKVRPVNFLASQCVEKFCLPYSLAL